MSVKAMLVSKLQVAFGDYVEGLTAENLKMQVMAGTIEQQDLRLKKAALAQLNLPIEVLSGFLGKFSVSVPWRNLSKERVVVTIEDVFLVAAPNHDNELAGGSAEERLECLRAALELKLKRVAEREMLRQAMNETDGDGDGDGGSGSMAERLGRIVLNNLQVTVKNVHCRFEDVPDASAAEASEAAAAALRPVAMGVKMTELRIHTIDEQGQETFQTDGTAQNKEIRLQGLSLYSENPTGDDQLSRKLTAGAGDADLGAFFKGELQRLEFGERRYVVATEEDIVLRAKLPERGTKQISSVLEGLQVRWDQGQHEDVTRLGKTFASMKRAPLELPGCLGYAPSKRKSAKKNQKNAATTGDDAPSQSQVAGALREEWVEAFKLVDGSGSGSGTGSIGGRGLLTAMRAVNCHSLPALLTEVDAAGFLEIVEKHQNDNPVGSKDSFDEYV